MTSKSTTSAAARLLLLPLLLAGAIVLWLMTGPSGHAATATQSQALQATVTGKTIAWGSGGSCTQDMGTADFGSVVPGASAQSSTFTGCVTSNASGWSVTAAVDVEMTAPGFPVPNYIPRSALVIEATSTGETGGTTPCTVGSTTCTLERGDKSLLSGATSTATSGPSYRYVLNVPANQRWGTYTGGQVTLIASN
jgi:hypothetical protein